MAEELEKTEEQNLGENEESPEEKSEEKEEEKEEDDFEPLGGKEEEETDPSEEKTDVSEEKIDASEEETEEEDDEPLKFEVEGKEVEVKPEDVFELAQKGLGADKKFQEAAAKEKQIAEFIENMKDPAKLPGILKNLGIDPYNFAENLTYEKVQEDLKPEDQKAREKYERELQELKNKMTDQEKAAHDEKVRAQQAELQYRIEDQIKEGLLPDDDETFNRYALELEKHERKGANLMDVDMNAIRESVEGEYVKGLKHLVEEMSEEELAEVFGEKAKVMKPKNNVKKDKEKENDTMRNIQEEQAKKKRKKKKVSWEVFEDFVKSAQENYGEFEAKATNI